MKIIYGGYNTYKYGGRKACKYEYGGRPAPPFDLKTAFLSVPRGFGTVSVAVGRVEAGQKSVSVANRLKKGD
jgi:hypothetical protein